MFPCFSLALTLFKINQKLRAYITVKCLLSCAILVICLEVQGNGSCSGIVYLLELSVNLLTMALIILRQDGKFWIHTGELMCWENSALWSFAYCKNKTLLWDTYFACCLNWGINFVYFWNISMFWKPVQLFSGILRMYKKVYVFQLMPMGLCSCQIRSFKRRKTRMPQRKVFPFFHLSAP